MSLERRVRTADRCPSAKVGGDWPVLAVLRLDLDDLEAVARQREASARGPVPTPARPAPGKPSPPGRRSTQWWTPEPDRRLAAPQTRVHNLRMLVAPLAAM